MRKIFVCKHTLFLIILACGILFNRVVPANGKEPGFTATLKGAVIDYEWAHAAHKLAILWQDQHSKYWLYVVDADQKAITTKIRIPAKYHPKCMAWLRDDAGFLLAMSPANVDDESALIDAFYRYALTEKRFTPVYRDVEVLYAQIFDIVLDSGSSYWAAASVGEGHPDIGIYDDAKLVLATDVYPSFISSLAWQNQQLYCFTGAYLEYGLTREEREKNPQFQADLAEGRAEGVIYRIDPATKRAEPVSTPVAYLRNDSYDRKYLLTMQNQQDTFTITLTRLAKN